MSDCIFCKIIQKEISSHTLYEDDDVIAFLDAFPTTAGHTLVVPKKHYERFNVAPLETVQKVVEIMHRLAPMIVSALGASAFNLGLNNGSDAGQVVPHLHWHVIPRYANDGLRAWEPKTNGSEELAAVADRLHRAGLGGTVA